MTELQEKGMASLKDFMGNAEKNMGDIFGKTEPKV